MVDDCVNLRLEIRKALLVVLDTLRICPQANAFLITEDDDLVTAVVSLEPSITAALGSLTYPSASSCLSLPGTLASHHAQSAASLLNLLPDRVLTKVPSFTWSAFRRENSR